MSDLYTNISKAIIAGDMEGVVDLIKLALEQDLGAGDILHQGMIPAMEKVGELFEAGEFYVPEMLVSARAMQRGLDNLRPLLQSSGVESAGNVVVGTVQGDLHDIGKNLVALMLEGAGYEIIDLGTDVSPEAFLSAINELPTCLVALSALLTTTMPSMETIIKAIEEAGVRDRVKIMVGGAPVTQEYAEGIGADGFAADASQAVKLAKSFGL